MLNSGRMIIICLNVSFVFGLIIICTPRVIFAQDEDIGDSIEFPGLEPFQASRMWPVLKSMYFENSNLDSMIFIFETLAKNQNKSVEMVEQDGYDIWPDKDDPAVFDCGLEKNPAYFALPWLMSTLRQLWDKREWTPDDIEMANKISGILENYDGSPKVKFTNNVKNNLNEIGKISVWFQELTGNPEIYGRMIFTFDDGPWRPLPLETDKQFPAIDSQLVGSDFSLRLCRIEDINGQWCLQCVKDNELLWSIILSKIPGDHFGFHNKKPMLLGNYGWKISMEFGEYVHLYLDPDGQPLFYFTSW